MNGRKETGSRRTGGALLVDQLRIHGVELAFCVPGESFLPVLDALYDSPIRLISCRHEAAAATMAEAYGKLTGRPGICLVTRGPGATHAAVGVHTAYQDSTPMVLLIGQVPSDFEDREAFQELDYRRMFASTTKWVAQVEQADRIPEYIARAFATACAGRPGPVVLSLPENMLYAATGAQDALRFQVTQPHPGHGQIERLQQLLAESRRPLVVLGGAGWTEGASRGVQRFLEANVLPAGAAFRRQDSIDNDSPSYVGDVGIGVNPKLAARIRESDLLLVVGPRLGEMTTSGYSLVDPTDRQRSLVHVHPGAEELGSVYQPLLAILAGMEPFADAVRDVRVEPRWREWAADARADYEDWQRPPEDPDRLDLAICVWHLRERLPHAIVANGVGNFSAWVHRYWRWHSFPTQLAPTSGAMGYGLPAALAAKAALPDATVVCFTGDGDFLMSGQELATAMQYDLPVLVVVVNNGMYGTIRMHQERKFPGREIGTQLVNPDFVAFAHSFGAYAEAVTKTSDFAAALERALKAGAPALLELRVGSDRLTPEHTLTGMRAASIERPW